MTSISLTGVGPIAQDPWTNNIGDWDAVLALRTKMLDPSLSLDERAKIAANPGLEMPQGTKRLDGAKTTSDKEEGLKLFNAVVDALFSLATKRGFDLTVRPKDIRVLDIFYMSAPKPGYTVSLVVKNDVVKVPVYQRF